MKVGGHICNTRLEPSTDQSARYPARALLPFVHRALRMSRSAFQVIMSALAATRYAFAK